MKTLINAIILTSLCTVLFALQCLATSTMAAAQSEQNLIVVANVENKLSLSKQEVKSLFMGAYIGHDLKVITLPRNHVTRVTFNTIVIGLTEDRIQSYWAQMRFSGRSKQPKSFNNEDAIIRFLEKNNGSVAYLPADTALPDNLKVLFKI